MNEVNIRIKFKEHEDVTFICPPTFTLVYVKNYVKNATQKTYRLLYERREWSDYQTLVEIEPEVKRKGYLEFFAVEASLENTPASTKVNNILCDPPQQ